MKRSCRGGVTPRFAVLPLLAVLVTGAAATASAQGVVNVYTGREPGLYSATLDEFAKASGIKVNTIFAEQGLAQRIQAEGAASPADVLITVDIGRLQEAIDLGITQPVRSAVLEEKIPAQYRDPAGHWFALSLRSRVVYAAKDRVKQETITYEELADPKWKGRICIRSGQHPYNLALVAAIVARKGEAGAEQWLRGVKANLARKPSGGDRDVAKDIMAGVCDIGLANAYYIGLMQNREAPERKTWAEAVRVLNPRFENGGTHVNVSGAVVAKNAPNRDNAVKLLEFMVSERAQQVFADVNYEYPVRVGIAVNPLVASFGALKADDTPVSRIAALRKTASEIIDRVGFDQGP
jgi:iron(III) transport system substrate-binding protein